MRRLLCLAVAIALAACGGGTSAPSPTAPGPVTQPPGPAPDTATPTVPREMRGVWIATVANIDWPSRSALSADVQRAELIDILDRAVAAGLNSIVFHVRPASDAVYQSSIEPWGLMLTGVQGMSPGYDPLAFAVEEAHRRGLELHAWINPFRAGNVSDTVNNRFAPQHVFRSQRNLVRIYGSQVWLDPGEPAVQDHVMRVIRDIVSRYDIDAIHADDYFYPYPVSGQVFPDDTTFARYGAGMTRSDWRRANVNRFVERMYREVHELKPTVKVGISPFGIWRPGNPAGIVGLDAYSDIYADSRKWLVEGWVDYLAPQLYWSIASTGQSFPALFDWWVSQNARGRHMWPGLATYRVQDGTSSAFSLTEIPDQIGLTRTRPGGSGYIFYNTSWTLKRNASLVSSLTQLQVARAVPPAYPWLDAQGPVAPSISVASGGAQVDINSPDADLRWWVIRARRNTTWTTRVVPATDRTVTLTAGTDRVLVQAVDRANNMSTATEWRAP